mmetsp:Transcript_14753/g.39128  ORF Transcript_14753/g.39128 Transcript_14753/m.39128 type:complete len:323 (-) Transcript_14753:596-1564(-)
MSNVSDAVQSLMEGACLFNIAIMRPKPQSGSERANSLQHPPGFRLVPHSSRVLLLRRVVLLPRIFRRILELDMRLILLGLHLQVAVKCEGSDVADDRAPDDDIPRVGHLALQAGQQRQEDQGRLVEVTTECSCGRGQGLHDRELAHVVHEGKDAREKRVPVGVRTRLVAELPGAHHDLPVRRMVDAEPLVPLAWHGLLHEEDDGQEEERGRDRHVGDRVHGVEVHAGAEDAREGQVQGAAEEGGEADEDAEDVDRGAALGPFGARRGRDGRCHSLHLRPREDAGARDADAHEEDLQGPARLLGVEVARREHLLGEKRRERQA